MLIAQPRTEERCADAGALIQGLIMLNIFAVPSLKLQQDFDAFSYFCTFASLHLTNHRYYRFILT